MENGHRDASSRDARRTAALLWLPVSCVLMAIIAALFAALDVFLLPEGYTLASFLAPVFAYIGALVGFITQLMRSSPSGWDIIRAASVMGVCAGFMGFLLGAPQALGDVMQLLLETTAPLDK